MKKVDLAMVPIDQELIPMMKKNIKRLGEKMTLGEYIRYTTNMHNQVLDRLKVMEDLDKLKEPEDE